MRINVTQPYKVELFIHLFWIFIQDNTLQYQNIAITKCPATYIKLVINNSKINKSQNTKKKIKAVHNASIIYVEPKATRNQIPLEL